MVRLNRFRGFDEFEAELRPLTAMIGKNSSGKTSVLQAVRLAYDAAQLALSSEQSAPRVDADGWIWLCEKLIVTDPSRLMALSDWRQLFKNGEIGDGLVATIDLQFDSDDPITEIRISLLYGRNAQLVLSVSAQSPVVVAAISGIPKKSKDRPVKIRNEVTRQLPIAVFVPAFYGVTRLEEPRTTPAIGRALGGGDQSHIVRNLVSRLDPSGWERLNQFLFSTIGARCTKRTMFAETDSTEYLSVSYVDTNGDLELSSAGAGLVSMIALWAALERTRFEKRGPAVFLLDEPEAHMHPRLQGDLGEAIAQAAEEYGVQLLLATHSVEMINRLGQQPRALLLAIDRSTKAATALTSEADIITSLDQFCDLTPYASLNFLASRRVVFYEGSSDWKILNACARAYFKNDAKRLAAWQRYVPIALDGVGNVSAHGVLQKLLSPSVFPARIAASAPVRAILVQDRDATREPRSPSLEKPKPHLEVIEVVWSRYSIESLFLDVSCLVEWLRPLGLGSDTELQQWLQSSISKTDSDEALNDAAVDARERYHLRADAKGNVNARAAKNESRKEVREAPAVWQKGRDRAKKILHYLRESLPNDRRRLLRGALDDVITSADSNVISASSPAIPPEIRDLFDAMVA